MVTKIYCDNCAAEGAASVRLSWEFRDYRGLPIRAAIDPLSGDFCLSCKQLLTAAVTRSITDVLQK